MALPTPSQSATRNKVIPPRPTVAITLEPVHVTPEPTNGRPKPPQSQRRELIDLADLARQTTDAGNAARLAIRFLNQLRFAYGLNQWLAWDGRRWATDQSGTAVYLATVTALAIYDEAKSAERESTREALTRWALQSQKRERINAMLDLAKPYLSVTPDQLDADPFVFNVTNGTIDLKTGKLHDHDPSALISKLAPVKHDPTAEAPRWLGFLDRIFAGDAELIEFVQRWLGYCMTADVREQLLPVLFGTGANGKSTLLDTVAAVVGDYAGTTTTDVLIESRSSASETRYELADLVGKRLIVANEAERGRRLRLGLVKSLTGDDQIKARPIYGRPFTYHRTYKPLLVTNHKPRVDEDSEAAWRRLRLIPFNVIIPKAERDPMLLAKLRAEGSGILAWLVRGCLDWQRHGLGEPEAITVATGLFRIESNPMLSWMSECCTPHANNWQKTAELRRSYEQYCAENGFTLESGKSFTDFLRAQGFTPKPRNAGKGWAGIGLLTEEGP